MTGESRDPGIGDVLRGELDALRVVVEHPRGRFSTMDLQEVQNHFALDQDGGVASSRDAAPLFTISSDAGGMRLLASGELPMRYNGEVLGPGALRQVRPGDCLQVAGATTVHFTLDPESLADGSELTLPSPVGSREARAGTITQATPAEPDPEWLSSCESDENVQRLGLELESELAQARKTPARKFGRYLLLSELGRGGFGCVFRAWDTQLERLVAVKVLLRANSDHARERFVREIKATARLRHRGIVTVHDSGERKGLPFLVMDYVQGRTLEELVHEELEGMVPAERMIRTARIMRDVARAVEYAHQNGVIHRDLKPPNVLIDRADHPYVVDFGLARLKYIGSDLTQTGTAIGTPLFMAPEQAAGHATSKKIDVYALGASLFFALTGRPPHEAESVTEFFDKLIAGADPPSVANPDVPPMLDEICAAALEAKPEERCGSAAELAEALDAFLAQASQDRGARRSQPLLILLVALSVVLLGVLIALLVRDRDRDQVAEDRQRQAEEDASARAAEVDRILDRVEDGGDPEQALLELVRGGDQHTVTALAARLDRVSGDLVQAERRLLLEAKEPTPDERQSGKRSLAGLEAAFERKTRLDPGGSVSKEDDALLSAAMLRLERRARRADRRLIYNRLAGERQSLALGEHRLEVANIACRVLGLLGWKEVAVTSLGRYLRADRDLTRAHFAVVSLERLGGAEAQTLLDTVGRPARVHEMIRVAEELEAKSKVEQAEQEYTRAVGLDPKLPNLLLRRAAARKQLNRLADARADVDAALKLDSSLPEAFLLRALIRSKQGETQPAILDLDRAISLDRKDPKLFLTRGNLYFRRKQLTEALADFDRAIDLSLGKDPRPYVERAKARLARKELGLAERDLDRALALEPDHTEGLRQRAALLFLRKDFDRSAELMTRVLAKSQRALDFYFRARAYLKANKIELGRADVEQALRKDPRCVPALLARAQINERADPTSAMRDFGRAVELDPSSAQLWDQLGRLAKTSVEARSVWLKTAERVLDTQPNNEHALYSRIIIRGQFQSRWGEALTDADRLVGLRGKLYTRALFARALGRTQVKPARRDGARQDLRRLLQLEDKGPLADKARRLLKDLGGD